MPGAVLVSNRTGQASDKVRLQGFCPADHRSVGLAFAALVPYILFSSNFGAQAMQQRLISFDDIPSNVVRYFDKRNPGLSAHRREIFESLIGYLSKRDGPNRVPSPEVDEAWHAFILHTKDYMEFCNSKLGFYVHHIPDDQEQSALSGDCDSGCSSSCSRLDGAVLQ